MDVGHWQIVTSQLTAQQRHVIQLVTYDHELQKSARQLMRYFDYCFLVIYTRV